MGVCRAVVYALEALRWSVSMVSRTAFPFFVVVVVSRFSLSDNHRCYIGCSLSGFVIVEPAGGGGA